MKNKILYHRTLIYFVIGCIGFFEVYYFLDKQEQYIAGILTTCASLLCLYSFIRVYRGFKLYWKRKQIHASGTQSPDNDDKPE